METKKELLEDHKITVSVRIQKSLLALAFEGLQHHDKFLYENMKRDRDYQKLSKLVNEIIDLGLAAMTQFTNPNKIPKNEDMLFISDLTKQKKTRKKRNWDQ